MGAFWVYVRFYTHFDVTIRFGPVFDVFRFSAVWATLFDLYPPPKRVVFGHLRISVQVGGYTFCLVNIEQIRAYTQKLAAKS